MEHVGLTSNLVVSSADPGAALSKGKTTTPASVRSSNQNKKKNSISGSWGNYGMTLVFVVAVLSAALFYCVPHLYFQEGRVVLQAALLHAASSNLSLVFCFLCFFFGCLGSILYNSHLVHNCRLERFVLALVRKQRMQQQGLYKRQYKDPQQHNQPESQQLVAEQKQKPQGQSEECCPCESEGSKVGVLFVTAHPDDESMFFSPTLSLFAANKEAFEVFVLCLSNGGSAGLGAVRSLELHAAADFFGVPRNNFVCLDTETLKDSWSPWPPEAVCQEVKKFICKNRNIQVIFSFDRDGVSSHPNHISVHQGLRLFSQELVNSMPQHELPHTDKKKTKNEKELRHEREQLRPLPPVFLFALQSHTLLRKYCGILSIIPATVAANHQGVYVIAAAVTVVVASVVMLVRAVFFLPCFICCSCRVRCFFCL
ncbi:uncharacterized protein LOC34621723 [Cyclospora cayetanensis]|uniref:N-acetylglucosaminylphosphatidylinositol deacetylase n=1 Tax=Cyclospora cayetanensis TaxID=88456 RepID=A0A6P6S2A1_9EIME|nr:uncharacterized protein LOC34621723 [Cyclospora cayetanensis]